MCKATCAIFLLSFPRFNSTRIRVHFRVEEELGVWHVNVLRKHVKNFIEPNERLDIRLKASSDLVSMRTPVNVLKHLSKICDQNVTRHSSSEGRPQDKYFAQIEIPCKEGVLAEQQSLRLGVLAVVMQNRRMMRVLN